MAFCCDVGARVGSLHVVRCLALAEEVASRGVDVVFVCDADAAPWAQSQIAARGLEVVAPPGFDGSAGSGDEYVELCDRLGVGAVVFDSRLVSGPVHAAVRRSGRPTLAIVDGDAGAAGTDVLVDPNAGADEGHGRAPGDATLLRGLDYALMRNDVLANRPISAPQHPRAEVPRVMAVFDEALTSEAVTAAPGAAQAATAMARVLADTGRPFEATFVTADAAARSGVEAVRPAPRQRIDVVSPHMRLVEKAVRSDVVLAVAGPTAAELLCLGAAVGLVWAVEDQVPGYRSLMVQRAVVGLGSAQSLADDPTSGVEKATRLLGDARERTRLAEAGWGLVDGFGRARVVDTLLALL